MADTLQYDSAMEFSYRDQDSFRVSLFLGETLDDIIALSLATKDSELIRVETNSVVPLVSNCIFISDGDNFTQASISSVTLIGGNIYDLGLSIPLDHSYSDNTQAILQNTELNVDGSTIAKYFKVKPFGSQIWDICRIIISMTLDSAGDDGLFGDQPALVDSQSQYFRKEDGTKSQNLFCVRDNSDFAVEGFDTVYVARSGNKGSFGTRSRISFNGNDKSGVVIKLKASNNDSLTSVIRADLTGINSYKIKVQGHVAKSNFIKSFWDYFRN